MVIIAGKIGGNLAKTNHRGPYQLITHNSNVSLEANANGPNSTDLIVVDPKRRRMDLELEKPTITSQDQNEDTEMEINCTSSLESKNELLAGAAVQTRQSL